MNQPADDLVRIRNFAVIRRVRGEPLGRRVRLMRLVQMQEQKGARRADAVEPALGDLLRFAAVPLQCRPGRPVRCGAQIVVEEIEPLIDAGTSLEPVGRHDRGGRIAALAEQLRQQPLARLDRHRDVVAHSGFERKAAREEGCMRRQRLRRVRIGAFEHHAVRGEQIDRRRLQLAVSVRRQVIGSQRVDGYDDDRAADRSRCARITPPSGC
jgi:hypothetical protein